MATNNNIAINPITQWQFWSLQKKEIESFQDFLARQSEQIQSAQWIDAEATKEIIKDRDAELRSKYEQYKRDIGTYTDEYKGSLQQQRLKAQGILKEQEAWVGFESQIQAAKAWKSGTLAQSQLAKISWDIANKFLGSLTEARNNLATFEQWLDEKLNTLNFTSQEKKQLLDWLVNVLDVAEAQPALDAIAKSSTTREEFLKMFSAFYSDLQKTQIGKLTWKWEEEQRYAYDKEAFAAMAEPEKRDFIIWKLGLLINLTPEQRNKFAEDAMKTGDYASVFADMDRMKKLNEQQILLIQNTIQHAWPWTDTFKALRNMLWIPSTWLWTDTLGGNITWSPEQIAQDKINADKIEEQKRIDRETKYTFGNDIPETQEAFEIFKANVLDNYDVNLEKKDNLIKIRESWNEKNEGLKLSDAKLYYLKYNALIKELINRQYLTSK